MQPASTGTSTQADPSAPSTFFHDSSAISNSPHHLAASTSSADSPTLGDKPARPPKAAHRLSTGSIYQQQQGDVPTMTDTEAGSAAPVSSVERVDDAAAGRDLASSNEPVLVPATSVGPPLGGDTTAVDASKRSSAADASVSAQTGESSTAKVATAPGSTSTSLPSPAPAAATKPTTPSSSTAPASRSAPATASRTSPPSVKKKRKGGLSSLFACLPCFGSTGHDDTPANPSASSSRPAATAATRVNEQEKRNVAVPDSKDTSTSSSKEKDAVAAAAAAPVTNEKSHTSVADAPAPTTTAAVEPESAITPTTTEPLVAASSGDAAAAQLAPPPTSAPAQRGVMLSQEETEGVTSGAVVPPGQAPTGPLAAAAAAAAAGVGAAAVAAPKSKRKRSGKHPNSNSATDGIITSVPEPGAQAGPRGGALFARQAGDETSSEDISSDEDDDEEGEEDEDEEEEEEDEEAGLIARGGVGIPIGEDGLPHPLLDDLTDDLKGRKCLVLDLDETLVHSSFKMVHQADYVVPVEIENQFHNVYVIKRPGVDAFLKAMGEIYEVVVFTASLSKYADPVLDQLDVHRVVKHRLFRESCYNNKGNYVKDLSQLGRPIAESIIIDNSPASYVFHPNNAVPISSWFNDPHDTELTDLVPFLADLSTVDDVRSVLDANLYLQPATSDAQTDGVFQQL
ncbi:hypothetical protein JCM8208_006202 [Rhodotorula glutinis]